MEEFPFVNVNTSWHTIELNDIWGKNVLQKTIK